MRLPPIDRVFLTVPFDDIADARLLGATWNPRINSWWIARDSIAGNPYVYRWMPTDDPMRKAARSEFFRLARENRKKVNAIRRSSRSKHQTP